MNLDRRLLAISIIELSTMNNNTRSRSAVKPPTSPNVANDSGIGEKEAKVLRSQSERLRHFMLFFVGLLFTAYLVANQEEQTHIHSPVSPAIAVDSGDIGPSEQDLQRKVDELDAQVRDYKSRPDVIMETDSEGLKLTKELQQATHRLLVKRYGQHTFGVRVDVTFPEIITTSDGLPASDYIVIELAPIDLIPCSVYNFLEIARTWKSGAFHRNADHVLQVAAHSEVTKSMPFQEYSKDYPHKKWTTGYAGRPSGPGWYVSIRDNTINHGPGSQQEKNPYEADSLFGRVVRGIDDVVPRIHSTPQKGWLDKPNQIRIPKMTILIKQGEDDWVQWAPSETETKLAVDR